MNRWREQLHLSWGDIMVLFLLAAAMAVAGCVLLTVPVGP